MFEEKLELLSLLVTGWKSKYRGVHDEGDKTKTECTYCMYANHIQLENVDVELGIQLPSQQLLKLLG